MTGRRFKILFFSLWILIVAGFAASWFLRGDLDLGQSHVSANVKEIEGYKNWTKVNKSPRMMPGEVSILCAAPSSRTDDPHGKDQFDKYYTVYVNDKGRDAMLTQKSPQFPEGSVIVKEKLTTYDGKTPELMTVMIKQKKGTNPLTGDWDYMVVDATGTKIEARGNLANCQACHAGQSAGDYVFRTYLDQETQKKLR
jgi:hypothetical protein